MARFVILDHRLPDHHARADHFDLMIEMGDQLATWALESWPDFQNTVRAERLPDHRREYLTLEGPISGGRGEVRQIDRGTCRILQFNPSSAKFELQGETVRGRLTLRRDDDHWWASLEPLSEEPD